MNALLISSLPWFVAGALGWTLLEYWLHRGLGHRFPRNPFGAEHTRHHATTHYFAPALKKAAFATPVVLGVAGAFSLLGGPARGIAAAAGLTLAWLAYEVVHRRAHTHGPRGVYGRWLRRHHFHHHFHAPALNHGVTSPVWDVVFGTLARPGVIRVPEKHALEWLLGEDGEVRPELAGDYELVRKKRRRRVKEEVAVGV
ncbi:MAG: sterol desaturase family protein [Planctomycetota bacterium]